MRVQEWFRRKEQPSFYLGGLAGTGKTTLARMFAEGAGNVMFGAYTGKAASVLRSKGCPGATTLHSLIYRPKGDSLGERIKEVEADLNACLNTEPQDERVIALLEVELKRLKAETKALFEKKAGDDVVIKDADLVVVDECSMLSEYIGRDLESYGVPILYLGDYGQLPPVNGKALLANRRPDFVLTEIHRQAAESAIIRVAHEVRETGDLRFGHYNDDEVVVEQKAAFDWDVALGADQVLCGKNDTRRAINRQMRKRLGRTQLYPVAGDKLICLQNDKDDGLLNGVTCRNVEDSRIRGNIVSTRIDYEGTVREFHCDAGHFEENYGRRKSFPHRDAVQHFDYGYAITGHKSQGSQWDRVVVCDDRMQISDREMRRKWLYTVITRAAKSLVVYA